MPKPISAPAEQRLPPAMRRATATTLTLVVAAIVFIDRPVADFAHTTLGAHTAIAAALTHLVDPIPVCAGLVAAWFTGAALCGVKPGPRGIVALRIALAVLVAIALKEQIKVLSGRTWPETWTNHNPSYIKDGVFGFFPLQGWASGGRGYHSFPSGHMTMISVAAMSVALNWPTWRWWAAIPVALVAIGMIGANFHWVSDLIAGTALGAAVAVAAHRLGQHLPTETS